MSSSRQRVVSFVPRRIDTFVHVRSPPKLPTSNSGSAKPNASSRRRARPAGVGVGEDEDKLTETEEEAEEEEAGDARADRPEAPPAPPAAFAGASNRKSVSRDCPGLSMAAASAVLKSPASLAPLARSASSLHATYSAHVPLLATVIVARSDAAGLPKANVHYYFQSKSKLYNEVLKDITRRWNDILDDMSEDGDPVDVLVMTPFPLLAGSVIKCRPVGVLNMTDESGKDAKVLAVPVDKLSTIYRDVKEIADVPPLLLKQIEHFFEHYKDLEEGKWVKIDGWADAAAAKEEITASIARFEAE